LGATPEEIEAAFPMEESCELQQANCARWLLLWHSKSCAADHVHARF
jgi:hypothetical protein